MNIDDLYPSKTIRAEELALMGHVDVTVEAIELVEFRPGEGDTVILNFMGKAQGLAMNKTRNMAMKGFFGSETDNWIGKTIRLMSMPSRKPDGTPCMTVVIQKAPELASDPPAPGAAMKYRSEIPPSSEKWIRGLFEELGVPYGFWQYWPKGKKLPRMYRLALCLAILRLKLAHRMSLMEISKILKKSREGLHPYSQRGDWILSLNPVFERAFTKMEGELAPAFLVHQWRDLWETLMDPSADERELI